MNTLLTIFYFLLALLLLVLVHESGHFLVARLCGVKVLRFSFGFGKVLARWQDKRGTEFVWSVFPLGGYVKMLNEEEGAVADAEKHLAFNQKSVWARIAIVSAGPLFNFIFAFVAFWLVLIVGIKSLAPMVDSVIPESIAAKAGITSKQEIIAFNGKTILSWQDFQYALMSQLGTTDSVSIEMKSMVNGERRTVSLPLNHWRLNDSKPDVLASIGIKPFIPKVPPIVGEVLADSPAKKAGFQVGDVVQFVGGERVSDWLELLAFVRHHPGKRISVTVMRRGKQEMLSVKLAAYQDKKRALLGVRSERVDWPTGWLRVERKNPVEALGVALRQTVQLTGTTFSLIGRLVMGRVSLRGISGPIGIAEGAGVAAEGGFSYYVSFLALVSISLGVLNLLPIPVLDGGYLLYYFIEIIRRRPLSCESRMVGMTVGFVFLMALMLLAVTNDLGRLVSQF